MSTYEGKHRTPQLCLPCRFGLCRLPVWVIRGLGIAGVAADLYIVHRFGVI